MVIFHSYVKLPEGTVIQVISLFQTGGAQPSSGALHRGAMERGAHRGGFGAPASPGWRRLLLGPQNAILARQMAGNPLTMQGFWPKMVKFLEFFHGLNHQQLGLKQQK